MKAAVIAPSRLLKKYAVTGYHLALCHLVESDPEYADFYRSVGASSDDHFIILDNSAHELGEGMTSAMEHSADLINPDEVVLPDRLFNAEDTVDFAKDAIDNFRHLGYGNRRIMGVPQGTTIPEWDWCCQELIALGVDTIGISKDYETWEEGLVGRVQAVREFADEVWNPSLTAIHMLGWGRQLWQLQRLRGLAQINFPKIRGVDSGKPLVYAWGGIDLAQVRGTPKYPKRIPSFFDLDDDDIPTELALSNINQFRLAAGDLE